MLALDGTYGNRIDDLAEEAEHGESFSSRSERAWKMHICRAASSGNWKEASSYDETHPNWFSIPLTEDGDTALHIAVSMERTSFVKKLVDRMTDQQSIILKAYGGNTPFCMAAISGNVEIATILLAKDPSLAWIRGQQDMLPIELASSFGHLHMVKFLFETARDNMHIHSPLQNMATLFFLNIFNGVYVVASTMLNDNPKLVSEKNDKGQSILEVLAQLSFDPDAPGYREMLSSLFKIITEKEGFMNSEKTSKAMFDAAKSGNNLILEFILNNNPNLSTRVDPDNGQTILHIAIMYRQVEIYKLILKKGAYKNVMVKVVDKEGNNVLHIAAKLEAEGRFGSQICQVLVCSEELWFKVVKKIVPATMKMMKNAEGWSPQELFHKEHQKISERAITELNEMASNLLVVGTLIVTLGITAALTIQTNPVGKDTPVFTQKTWYIIFLVSVGFGVSLSALSMLLFTSVLLPSIWKPKKRGYVVNSRLVRMACGYLLLYVAVGVMGTVSVTSGYILVYTFFPRWMLYLIAALGCVPVLLSFLIYDYSLKLTRHLLLAAFQVTTFKRFKKFSTYQTKWALF